MHHDVTKVNTVYAYRGTINKSNEVNSLYFVILFKIVPVYLAGLMIKATTGPHNGACG